MPRWIPRAVQALLVSIALPAAAAAQPDAPPPPAAPPPAATLPPATPAPVAPRGQVVIAPDAAIYVDPYHIATPYNPTVVNQNVPNPGFNRPYTVLQCVVHNQNLDPYEPRERECRKGGCGKGGKGGCGCEGGAGKAWLGKAGHGCEGSCSKGGSCTTCCNTSNFAFASSRSFFGESSRDFFERPASPDGIKMKPVKYAPPPAPAAYTPATVIVPAP